MRFRFLSSDGDGVIYGVKPSGELLWFRDVSGGSVLDWVEHWLDLNQPDKPGWASNSAFQVGSGWAEFDAVFAGGGNGVIYAIDPTGNLFWYLHEGRLDGSAAWRHSGTRQLVGTGFGEFLHVFPGGTGVIYTVSATGELFWYRHLGYADGTRRWANSGTRLRVGGAWQESVHLLGGGNGIIYAVDRRGRLLWYRHDGHEDGTPRWANGGLPRVIGVDKNWSQFTHVFSGWEGTIYALQCEYFANLLSYRHMSPDGADEWSDGREHPIAVGFESAALEGYCWPPSVYPGKSVAFFLSARNRDAVTVSFVRLKPADGALGVLMDDHLSIHAGYQASTATAWSDGCNWEASFYHAIPESWPTGIYAARCLSGRGHSFNIIFTVTPKVKPRAPLAILANTLTWNAYNFWGGRSNYSDVGESPLTFARPNVQASLFGQYDFINWNEPPPGNHTPLNHTTRAELWILNWLQDAGYRVDVYADLDFHFGIDGINKYKGIILSTHPEYWSPQMRTNLSDYLTRGGNLLYLGGNGLYRIAELPGTRAEFDRVKAITHISFQTFESIHQDPRDILGVHTPDPDLIQRTFAPYVVVDETHPFIAAAGLRARGEIGATGRNGAASGWEVDSSRPTDSSRSVEPARNPIVLASGRHPEGEPGNMTYYTHPGGGFVFSVGSIAFGGSLVDDPQLQLIVRAALDRCLARP